MKTPILLCSLFLSISLICKSQGYTHIYYLDAALSSTEKSKAIIVGKGIKENGLFRLDYFSIDGKHLYMICHYTDSTLSVPEGMYTSYHLNHKLDKHGNYSAGMEEGLWETWDSLGRKTDSTIYKKGKPFITAISHYDNKGGLSYNSLKDSLADTYYVVHYNEYAIKTFEANFKGHNGILLTYSDKGIKTDTVFTREEIEASFPGGEAAWRKYLQKNLNIDIVVKNGAPAGLYQTIIRFMIMPDGSIMHVEAETNLGYGMEEEGLRIIKNGPKWIPATQFGHKVKAFRRQPISFMFSED